MTRIIDRLAEIADAYDVLYCDLWGCLHDGVRVFDDAVAALTAFRQGGGTVILLTNSPRPAGPVAKQILSLGAPDDCYDAIISSGDAAQAALEAGRFGAKVFHIGPERDDAFFVRADGTPLDVARVALEEADSVVCTGLFDDRTETPEDYRLTLMRAKARGLDMLCANPDIIVDVGDSRIYCAGALGAFYAELGGTPHYFGKPHPPVYALARARAEDIRGPVEDDRILAVGDGIETDIRGGMAEGLDTLFVTGGLAKAETGTEGGRPDPARLRAFTDRARLTPTAAIGFLR